MKNTLYLLLLLSAINSVWADDSSAEPDISDNYDTPAPTTIVQYEESKQSTSQTVAELVDEFFEESKTGYFMDDIIKAITNILEDKDHKEVLGLASKFCKENSIRDHHIGSIIEAIANIPKDNDRETVLNLASKFCNKKDSSQYEVKTIVNGYSKYT